jgi:hypothetical protein
MNMIVNGLKNMTLSSLAPFEILPQEALVVVVALAEEIIFRGYVILRFRTVTGSLPATSLISAAIFSLGHGYEGPAGVITVGILGWGLRAHLHMAREPGDSHRYALPTGLYGHRPDARDHDQVIRGDTERLLKRSQTMRALLI